MFIFSFFIKLFSQFAHYTALFNSQRPLLYSARSMHYLGCAIPQGDYMLKLPQKHKRTLFLFLLFKIKISFQFLLQWGGTVIMDLGRREEKPQYYLIESVDLYQGEREERKEHCEFEKMACLDNKLLLCVKFKNLSCNIQLFQSIFCIFVQYSNTVVLFFLWF